MSLLALPSKVASHHQVGNWFLQLQQEIGAGDEQPFWSRCYTRWATDPAGLFLFGTLKLSLEPDLIENE